MIRFCVSGLLACSLLVAGPPVGKVTSAEPFRISGTTVPVAGVPNWPLVDGDEVALSKAYGELLLADGTRLLVWPDSKFAVTVHGSRTLVRLEQGVLAYRFAKDSTVDLAALDLEPIPTTAGEGHLMAIEEQAFWGSSEPAAESTSPQQNGDPVFESYRPTPYTVGFLEDWRNYNPDWGGGPPGPIPPGPVLQPPYLPPVSPWRPPGLRGSLPPGLGGAPPGQDSRP